MEGNEIEWGREQLIELLCSKKTPERFALCPKELRWLWQWGGPGEEELAEGKSLRTKRLVGLFLLAALVVYMDRVDVLVCGLLLIIAVYEYAYHELWKPFIRNKIVELEKIRRWHVERNVDAFLSGAKLPGWG